MISEAQIKDIQFVKDFLSIEIKKMKDEADKISDKLIPEVKISLVYMDIFSSYLEKQQFSTLEEAWRFMNDIKGIIDKMFYVKHYIGRIQEDAKAALIKK